MKTNLPTSIKTIEEAKAYLSELHKNGEAYHPEDDARDIVWQEADGYIPPNEQEQNRMNELMDELYVVANAEEFDPCEFILSLEFNADKKDKDA